MRLTDIESSLAIVRWGVAAGVVVIFTGCPAQPPINQPLQPGPSVTAAKPAASADAIAGGAKATSAPDFKPLFAGWPKPTLAFVFTGQQLGYIEPCGCTGLENQKGGLARRQTFLEQLVKERGWTVVPLDVGSQVKGFGKQQEVKFEHAVKGLRAMGYRGLTLGEGDLKLSPGSLLAAIGSADDGKVRDFLSANVSLYDRDVQPRFLVLEAGGKKIGVKDDDAGGAKTLGRDSVAAARQPPTRGDQSQTLGSSDHDPSERRDQVVLEGVFDHENDPEKKSEPAQPGEQLHSHERLPIERRGRQRSWW
jgi:hypothetical protein